MNNWLDASVPPADLQGPLLALWWQGKGDWDKAHSIVQDLDTDEAAWVHAHLHRVEGDLPNAGYWYRRAGQPRCELPLEQEWSQIVEALKS